MHVKQFIPVTALCFLGLVATLFGVGLAQLASDAQPASVEAVDASANVSDSVVLSSDQLNSLECVIDTLMHENAFLQMRLMELQDTPRIAEFNDDVFVPVGTAFPSTSVKCAR